MNLDTETLDNCSKLLKLLENGNHSQDSTLNGTEHSAQDSVAYGKIISTIIAIVIILLTIWGNILVITAVCMERKLRKVGNSFLVNLAISDCLVGCIVMPVALLYHLNGESNLQM